MRKILIVVFLQLIYKRYKKALEILENNEDTKE